jgi:predicted amidophosphoribosyltransferase
MSLIVQMVMRLMGKLGRPGERRCASCGRGYRPAEGDRGYCPRCVRESGSDKDKEYDSGRPFRED